jgi:hypothetical protein
MSLKRRFISDEPYCFEAKRIGANLTIIAGQEKTEFYGDIYSLANSSDYIKGRFSTAFAKPDDDTLDLTRFQTQTVRQFLIIHYYEAKIGCSDVYERVDALLELAGFLLHVDVIMFLLKNYSTELPMHKMFELVEKHNIEAIGGQLYAEWESNYIDSATPDEVRQCLDKESLQGRLYEKHTEYFMRYAVRHLSKKLGKMSKIRSLINKVIMCRTGRAKMITELTFDALNRACDNCYTTSVRGYSVKTEQVDVEYWCEGCFRDYAFLVKPE